MGTALVLAFALVSMAAARNPAAQPLAGRTIGVQDRDTLRLPTADRRQVRIRVADIDAPEARQSSPSACPVRGGPV
jgi:endonuclease YncB( thermonuclease family)